MPRDTYVLFIFIIINRGQCARRKRNRRNLQHSRRREGTQLKTEAGSYYCYTSYSTNSFDTTVKVFVGY